MFRSGRNSNSFEMLCMSLLPASIKRIGSKATKKRWRHHFPHYKSIGAFCWHGHQSFDPICLKILCSLSLIPSDATHKIWSRLDINSNSYEILCMSLLSASIKRIGSKTTEKRWRHRFPHYKSMGAFCCHGNKNFDPICPKTLCSLSPITVMLHIKFDQDWPTGFREI